MEKFIKDFYKGIIEKHNKAIGLVLRFKKKNII